MAVGSKGKADLLFFHDQERRAIDQTPFLIVVCFIQVECTAVQIGVGMKYGVMFINGDLVNECNDVLPRFRPCQQTARFHNDGIGYNKPVLLMECRCESPGCSVEFVFFVEKGVNVRRVDEVPFGDHCFFINACFRSESAAGSVFAFPTNKPKTSLGDLTLVFRLPFPFRLSPVRFFYLLKLP